MRLLLFIAAILFFASCNNRGKSTTEAATIDKTEIDKPANAPSPEAAQEKKDHLQQLVPHTLDQMKAMLPPTLAGAALKSAIANAAFGAPYASGEYALTDSTGLQLDIFDCAGQAGAGIYDRQYLAAMDFQPGDAGNSKVIDFNGAKAIEHMDNASQLATFTFLAADRFLVTLEGKNMDAGFLRKMAEGLELK